MKLKVQKNEKKTNEKKTTRKWTRGTVGSKNKF